MSDPHGARPARSARRSVHERADRLLSAVPSQLRRPHACGLVLASVLASVSLISPATLPAQTYDKTTFVHGFASSKHMWLDPRPELADSSTIEWLRSHERVNMRLKGTPDLDDSTRSRRFAEQRDSLRSFVLDSGGTQHVLVGHSMGSLLSRSLYIKEPTLRPRISAIVATTAPHQGADIAIYAPEARRYFLDLETAMSAALADLLHYELAIKFLHLVSSPFRLVWNAATGNLQGPEGSFVRWLGTSLFGANIRPDMVSEFDLGPMLAMTSIDALGDLPPLEYENRTDLPRRDTFDPYLDYNTIRELNASTLDAAVPRANVYADVGGVDAVPLKLFHTMSDDEGNVGKTKKERRDGRRGFTKCKKFAGFLSMGGVRARCGRAERMLWNMDWNWNRYTTGTTTRTVTLPAQFCSLSPECARDGYITIEEPIGGPSDGVVPNARSKFPGLTGSGTEFPVPNRNHMSIYRHSDGVEAIADAMFSVGVLGYPPFTGVALTGPTSLRVGYSGTWTATPSGGASPFRYRWTVDGVVVKEGTSDKLTWTAPNKTRIVVAVKATDDGLAARSMSRAVSMTGYTCPNNEVYC